MNDKRKYEEMNGFIVVKNFRKIPQTWEWDEEHICGPITLQDIIDVHTITGNDFIADITTDFQSIFNMNLNLRVIKRDLNVSTAHVCLLQA